jgi:hypothetical protein
MARELKANTVRVLVHWSGLAGRQISTLEPIRRAFTAGPSSQAEATSSLVIDANVISSTLAEQVANLTQPLFTPFDFFEMPLDTIESELERMRGQSLG